jgi:ribosome-associated protein
MPQDLTKPTSIPDDRSDSATGLDLPGGVSVDPSAVRFQFARSGGPGGQNVNKLNTKAELWVRLSGLNGLSPSALLRLRHLAGRRLTAADEIHITAETERSQESNRQAVGDKLRELILRAMVEPKRRRPTRPTAASKRRRLEAKRRRSETKSHRRGHAD